MLFVRIKWEDIYEQEKFKPLVLVLPISGSLAAFPEAGGEESLAMNRMQTSRFMVYLLNGAPWTVEMA